MYLRERKKDEAEFIPMFGINLIQIRFWNFMLLSSQVKDNYLLMKPHIALHIISGLSDFINFSYFYPKPVCRLENFQTCKLCRIQSNDKECMTEMATVYSSSSLSSLPNDFPYSCLPQQLHKSPLKADTGNKMKVFFFLMFFSVGKVIL